MISILNIKSDLQRSYEGKNMAATLDYTIQFFLNKISGSNILTQPMELFTLVILAISGVLLAGIIYELNKNYKETESVYSLYFLISMITLIISNVLGLIMRFCYTDLGQPGIGDFLGLLEYYSSQITYLFVNLFAFRATFPKHEKIVFIYLLLLSIGFVSIMTWAIAQGPPVSTVDDFELTFSFEIIIVRTGFLLAFFITPTTVFFYHSVKIREENRAHSWVSFWLGMGIALFATVILTLSTLPMLRLLQVLFIPAGIIFYTCFRMPDWFKRKIGWVD